VEAQMQQKERLKRLKNVENASNFILRRDEKARTHSKEEVEMTAFRGKVFLEKLMSKYL